MAVYDAASNCLTSAYKQNRNYYYHRIISSGFAMAPPSLAQRRRTK